MSNPWDAERQLKRVQVSLALCVEVAAPHLSSVTGLKERGLFFPQGGKVIV